MKLVYSKNRCNQADAVHRFDVLGEFSPSDLAVLKNSLFIFFKQLGKSGIVVLDISECTVTINEPKLQAFFTEVKTYALAMQIFLMTAQTDIESMHAEQNAVEQSLLQQINILENKLNLMESVKTEISMMKNENLELREKLKESDPKKNTRSFFEKLWGDV